MGQHTITVGLVLLGLGLLALLVGLRGKRIDREPRCPSRRCKYALGSVLESRRASNDEPFPLTCPECGRTIAHERALRIGTRKKRRWTVALGLALLIGGGATIAHHLANVPRATIAKHLPLAALTPLAKHESTSSGFAYQRELLERAASGRIRADRAPAIIEELLAWQQDESLDPVFAGRTLDALARLGHMTIEQQDRAWASMWSFTIYIPPTVAPGDPIPLTFAARYAPGVLGYLPIADPESPWFRNAGNVSMLQQTNLRAESIRINGREAPLSDRERWVRIESSIPRWRSNFVGAADWFPDVGPPASLVAPQGEIGDLVTIEIHLAWDCRDAGQNGLHFDREQGRFVTISEWLEQRGTPVSGTQTIRLTTRLGPPSP